MSSSNFIKSSGSSTADTNDSTEFFLGLRLKRKKNYHVSSCSGNKASVNHSPLVVGPITSQNAKDQFQKNLF